MGEVMQWIYISADEKVLWLVYKPCPEIFQRVSRCIR